MGHLGTREVVKLVLVIAACRFMSDIEFQEISYVKMDVTQKMVPGAGLEPARPFERGILNPLCLPISPPGQTT